MQKSKTKFCSARKVFSSVGTQNLIKVTSEMESTHKITLVNNLHRSFYACNTSNFWFKPLFFRTFEIGPHPLFALRPSWARSCSVRRVYEANTHRTRSWQTHVYHWCLFCGYAFLKPQKMAVSAAYEFNCEFWRCLATWSQSIQKYLTAPPTATSEAVMLHERAYWDHTFLRSMLVWNPLGESESGEIPPIRGTCASFLLSSGVKRAISRTQSRKFLTSTDATLFVSCPSLEYCVTAVFSQLSLLRSSKYDRCAHLIRFSLASALWQYSRRIACCMDSVLVDSTKH